MDAFKLNLKIALQAEEVVYLLERYVNYTILINRLIIEA